MARKRQSNDGSPTSKRAKNRTDEEQVRTYNDIDSIPLKSTPKKKSSLPVSTSSLGSTQTILSYFQRPRGLATSFSSSTASTSKNTSFSSELDTCLEDSQSDYFTSQESPCESEDESENIDLRPKTLQQRLNDVWPRFANETFNDAPLAITWEITRIALHCGVKLADCNVLYRDLAQWDTQFKLRAAIAQLPVFQNKQLPQPSSHEAWDCALKSFQSSSKAVTLSGELVLNSDSNGPLFSLKLSPLQVDRSHRAARRFGADRFLELLIPYPEYIQRASKDKEMFVDVIVRWLTGKKHYFLGRRWAAFFLKPGTPAKSTRKDAPDVYRLRVWFFACEGDSFRRAANGQLPSATDATTPDRRTTVKLCRFIDWLIGGLRITDQQVSKLFSRISLSLTRTFATIVLEKHQIYAAEKDLGNDNPMNDGIGRMSKSLATKISHTLGLTEIPSAFQARIGSAKGMWIIDNDPVLGDGDWIVTYPSQRKWNCDNEDIHHRTFEVMEWSKDPRSASLNQQFIPVLEEQAIDPGKMRATIATHLRNGLLEDLAAQKAAMEDPVDLRLWLQQGGGSRAAGLHNDCVPFLGGLPKNSENTIAFLLDSGFEPRRSKYLQDLCLGVVKNRAEALKTKMKICVPCSAYLFMVADFSSCLEEDEVHVSFSTKFQVEGFCDALLEDMDVLVSRAPCHLPSDIQRVRVVSKQQLRHLKDVVVFSTKGKSSLADKLSGGDYDGDRAWVCWDQGIVQNFCNAPMPTDDTDPIKLKHLQKIDRPITQICAEETSDDNVCAQFVYEAFGFNIEQFLVGPCTTFKERYCYHKNSVSNSKAILLSRMLGCLVDQSKQGFIFKQSTWDAFRADMKLPRFLDEPDYTLNEPSGKAFGHAVPHILDHLRHGVAKSTIDNTLQHFCEAINGCNAQNFDADLTRLFNYLDEKHKTRGEWIRVRQRLRTDIESISNLWTRQTNTGTGDGNYVATVGELYEMWRDIQPLAAVRSSDFVQSLLDPWSKDHHSTTWELLKASYAFKLFYYSKSNFVWQMAGRQLAILKQRMSEQPGHVVRPLIWAALRPDKKYIVARRTQRLAAAGLRDMSAADLSALDSEHDDTTVDSDTTIDGKAF